MDDVNNGQPETEANAPDELERLRGSGEDDVVIKLESEQAETLSEILIAKPEAATTSPPEAKALPKTEAEEHRWGTTGYNQNPQTEGNFSLSEVDADADIRDLKAERTDPKLGVNNAKLVYFAY
jgi:hypothetical protein